MNKMQRRAAMQAGEQQQPTCGGLVFACTQVRVAGQVFNRNQLIGPVCEVMKARNFSALLAARMIETRAA